LYIGQTIFSLEKRRYDHEWEAVSNNSSHFFHRALRKYGLENFDWQVIDKGFSTKDLNDKERWWIQFYKSFDPKFGYNMKLGGEGGGKSTEIVREKLRSSRKEYHPSEQTKQKLRLAQLGKKHSDETKKKMSVSSKGISKSTEHRNHIAESRKGIHHSDLARQRMSLSHKGKKLSQETRMKISISGRFTRSKGDQDAIC